MNAGEPKFIPADLVAIRVALERILANQEAFLLRFEEHVKDDTAVAMKVELIQTRMNYAIGAFATLSVVWAVIGGFVLSKLGLK